MREKGERNRKGEKKKREEKEKRGSEREKINNRGSITVCERIHSKEEEEELLRRLYAGMSRRKENSKRAGTESREPKDGSFIKEATF